MDYKVYMQNLPIRSSDTICLSTEMMKWKVANQSFGNAKDVYLFQ